MNTHRSDEIIRVDDLSVLNKGKLIFGGLSLRVQPHSVNALVGPSGIGKTTLLRAFNRLLDEDEGYELQGKIFYRGQDIYRKGANSYEIRQKIGMVFQKPAIFPLSIYDNVVFGVRNLKGGSKKKYQALVESSLKQAFLWDEVKDRLGDPAKRLSVGQQQRLAIARTLAVEPEVLLMDEPTASLDPRATKRIEDLILTLKSTRTIIFVTHDMRQASSISDQVFDFSQIQNRRYAESEVDERLGPCPEVQGAF